MIYLASPYSHPEPEMMELRYKAAASCTAALLSKKLFVYSPIVHCHPLSVVHELGKDFEYWKDYNLHMIDRATSIFVLTIEGWDKSVGIKGELAHAKTLRLPVFRVDINGDVYGRMIPSA